MLKALAEKHGAVATIFPISKDRISDLKKSISAAVKKNDIVVITGGVSVGKYDFTKPALLELGATVFFDKIALKPGKPTVFSKLGNTFIFGLPGNPVSAAVTFHLFVRQLIMQMQNAADTGMRHGFAVLNERAKGTKDRDTYLPSKLDTDKAGRLIAQPLKWHGSSDFIGFARAEALIIVPRGESFEGGDAVPILLL
jgi:molybdopterin molybdotransferase